jgi:predicted NACHT family NTPase
MAVFPDWDEYLRSVVSTYKDWWRLYTLTDAIGQEKPEPEPASVRWTMPFQFELMAQTVERKEPKQEGRREEERERIEHFPVLEGIRKYAADHVLLSGRPGSGKSTALARLLSEEAQQIFSSNSLDGQTTIPCAGASQSAHPKSPIPILIELRLWENSILDRILKTLYKHDPNLAIDSSTLTELLRQGRFLRLDRLNELSLKSARQDVIQFWADYLQALYFLQYGMFEYVERF